VTGKFGLQTLNVDGFFDVPAAENVLWPINLNKSAFFLKSIGAILAFELARR